MKYMITSVHHKHLGEVGSVVELSESEFGRVPHAHYLRRVTEKKVTPNSTLNPVGTKKVSK